MTNRYLAVDPGEKRIGLAMSDPTGTIASPLQVIKHVSREVDANTIAKIANQYHVRSIIIGLPLDSDGQIGPQARKSKRLGDSIQKYTETPIIYWDESHSTIHAHEAQDLMAINLRKRKATIDALAATLVLQSYLEFLRDRGSH